MEPVNDRMPAFHDVYELNIATGDKKLVVQHPGTIENNVVADIKSTGMKADGTLGVERSDVPYTNRILVRRPAQANAASGTVPFSK